MKHDLIKRALIEAAAKAGDNLADVAISTLTAYRAISLNDWTKVQAERDLKTAQVVAFAALLETELTRRYSTPEAPR
jgi:hypothetical protein